MNRQNSEDFGDSEHTLCDSIMKVTSYYTFVPIHRMYNSKSEL